MPILYTILKNIKKPKLKIFELFLTLDEKNYYIHSMREKAHMKTFESF